MYNHIACEAKWIKQWEETRLNQFKFASADKKYYILDMFPYPSASGLHIGHARSYTISDIIARYKKHCGFNVLHPIGWDAFGLPAEQFAIANNKNPRSFNEQNINIFRQQLKSLGFYYDYDYEINTSDPKYYQWTQWIFCQLVKNDLAQLKEVDVNWCEQLGTVLANDEIIIKNDKMFSERGNYPVIKKKQKQWVINITKYAARLAKDLEPLAWDDSIKLPQQQWIGLSSGCLVKFKTTCNVDINVYTTRPDTIYGVGFIAIAPENKLVDELTTSTHTRAIKEYIASAKAKTELQRKAEDKNKSGVFTGSYAINPCNEQKIPIYVADYVLNDYATGMVMGVPAHDQRDYDFATMYKLPIVKVIDNSFDNRAYEGDGKHINSPLINGLNIKEATKKIIDYLIKNKFGSEQQQTKLHDWIFSRQRYWGEPFPILFASKDEYRVVDLKDLPVVLPELDDYRPDHSGLPPLSKARDWTKVLINNKQYTRELSTMPGSAGSSWYFLAYLMKNPDGSYLPIGSKEAIERFNKWMPVDLYVGGNEHATGHCLYARFWHKFLHDLKLTKHPEPFTRCIDHGIILGPDGNRMSKSKGNVINPIDIINTHGADALRLYSAFIGPINGTFPWNPNGLDGMRKWLERVYRLFDGAITISDKVSKDTMCAYHTFVKNATQYMEEFKLNLVVSQMMIFTNHCYEAKNISKLMLSSLLIILSCFSPFIAEELWHNNLGNKDSVVLQPWPKYDDKLTQVNEITLPIQINGKLRATIKVAIDSSEQEVVTLAKQEQHVAELLRDKVKKVIYIKNKILNFIV